MANIYDVKITVLKRFEPAEVFEKSPVTPEQPMKACDLFEDCSHIGINSRYPSIISVIFLKAGTL